MCFFFKWQIGGGECVCMCVCLLFLLKYLSFVSMTPPGRLSLQEEDPGSVNHMLYLATPHTLLGLHVSATHFLQMQGDLCVRMYVWGPHVWP